MLRHMARFTISVSGVDRPGIVAALTQVLAEAGCNLEDATMTILRGQFAMMLVTAGPADPESLRQALTTEAQRLDVHVNLRTVGTGADGAEHGTPHVVTVYGADRPGLVARVSERLAAHQGNITGMTTRVVGEPEPVYVMHVEVDLDAEAAEATRADLDTLSSELDVEIRLHADQADVL